jgi:hypothetical protein
MELTNNNKKMQPSEGKADQADDSMALNNTTAKPNVDDMELNEEQLDIISGGGDLPVLLKI